MVVPAENLPARRFGFPAGPAVILAYALAALASLWLRFSVPLSARAENITDDALFVKIARFLLHGEWLGPYDDLTLAKGMFFPLFIACTSWLSIPLRMGEQAAYLAAAAIAGAFAGRFSQRPWLGAALFAGLAFDPLLWGPYLSMVLREGLYIVFPLALIALYAFVVFSNTRLRWQVGLSIVLGLVLGAFWLTREEGVWILPSLASLIGIRIGDCLTRTDHWPAKRQVLLRQALCAGVAIAICGLGNLVVATLNQKAYGAFETTEFKSTSFVRSYSALAGISPEQAEPKVVIPKAARALGYAASPSFAELKPFLDGELAEGWRRTSCYFSHLPPEQCREIQAGWFMWALRDAVAAAGHASSAREAEKFYKHMASEIEAACTEGRLHCAHRYASLAPPFRWRYVVEAAAPAWHLAKLAATVDPAADLVPPNDGTPEQLALFSEMFGDLELERNQPDHVAAANRDHPQHRIIAGIIEAYTHVTPFALGLGLFGFSFATLFLRRAALPLYALTLASLVAVACRICLLAYLDATSIPAAFELYLACVTPLVILSALTGCYLGLDSWASLRTTRRPVLRPVTGPVP